MSKETTNKHDEVNNVKKTDYSPEEFLKLIDEIYDKCLTGIPCIFKPADVLAEEYLEKYKSKEIACKKMFKNQIIKCTTSGFITSFGGIITLPVTVPVNIANVLFVQMQMIACAAYMAGYKLTDDSTQTLVYACLAGVSINKIVKPVGVKISRKFVGALVKKIPKEALKKINKKLGFSLFSRFGKHGLIRFGNLVPIAGALFGGSFDLVETKIIADRTYRWFFEDNFCSTAKNDSSNSIIDISPDDFEETTV